MNLIGKLFFVVRISQDFDQLSSNIILLLEWCKKVFEYNIKTRINIWVNKHKKINDIN